MNYSNFWRRLAAVLIDGIIINIVMGILSPIFGGGSADLQRTNTASGINLLVTWIYFSAFTIWKAQTPGKMALGIKVVAENGTLTPGAIVLRETVGKLLSAIPLCLGYFWMLWDPKKQTWHDKIAKTLVVKA